MISLDRWRRKPVASIALMLHPATVAHRYHGTIGRTLRRLAVRRFVEYAAKATAVNGPGWRLTPKGERFVTRWIGKLK